ncbi:hypothetical protein [Nonomuraea dietziae]|uniref:hypothetical protein n=1 Tax=Nonomuraea dietziae TaxID=65515 RepID=UPI0031E2CFE0
MNAEVEGRSTLLSWLADGGTSPSRVQGVPPESSDQGEGACCRGSWAALTRSGDAGTSRASASFFRRAASPYEVRCNGPGERLLIITKAKARARPCAAQVGLPRLRRRGELLLARSER